MKRTLKKSSAAPPKKSLTRKTNSTPTANSSKRLMKRIEPQEQPGKKSGRSLVRKSSTEEKKVVTGPIPQVPEGWKWKGKKDAKRPGFLHVKPDDMPPDFPRPNPLVPEKTFFRIDPKADEVKTLVTIMPDGLHVAWWTCPTCLNGVTRCICPNGFIHPRGIEWIHIATQATLDGVKFGEKVDCTGLEVTSRGFHWYKPKVTPGPSTGGRVIIPPKPRKTLSRRSEAPGKRSLTRKTTAPAADVERNYDSEAGKSADELTKSLTRKLSEGSKPKRTLNRKKQ